MLQDKNLDKKSKNNLILFSFITSFGGLLFGYNTAVINGSLEFMSLPSQLNLSPLAEGLVTGSITIGAALGALICGILSDRLGRKKLIVYLSLMFIVGTFFSSIVPNANLMIASRFFLGLAVGGVSVVIPTFLLEISTSKTRGSIVTLNNLMLVGGQFLAFLMNAILAILFANNEGVWRYMVAVAVIPAFLLFIGILFVPASPRWLFFNKSKEKALESLYRLRSKEGAQRELEMLNSSLQVKTEERIGFSSLNNPLIFRVILIGIGLGITQQLIGINVIMFYGTTILHQSGFTTQSALIANVANGLVSVLAVFLTIHIIQRVNRRSLILTGIACTTLCMSLITFAQFTFPNSAILPYLVTILTILFIAFFQGSIGPVTWLLVSEIFPQKIRGFGMGIAIFFLWIANFIVALIFPLLVASVGMAFTFLIFTLFNILSFLFTFKYAPETQGKSLEEIEESLQESQKMKT